MLPEPSVIKLKKLDATRRQLDAAVRAFFDGEDSVAVHTLVGAASNIISDLVEHQALHRSWDVFAAQDNRLSKSEYFRIARQAQNFFKHADRDADGELEFNQRDTECLMLASLNLGELNRAGEKHSIELSVFQLWYIAVWSSIWDTSDDTIAALVEQALRMFPHITVLPRDEQLRRGREALQELSH